MIKVTGFANVNGNRTGNAYHMRFLTHGNKSDKSVMLIHGMANTADLFDPLLEYAGDHHVIVCELDGHCKHDDTVFKTIRSECAKIERYVRDELDGWLSGLLGYSLGGAIATELISRGRIKVDRTILDAAYVIKMGIMTCPYTFLFQSAFWCMKKNISVPAFAVECVMGKGNSGITDTLYKGVSLRTIRNVCMSIYRYEIKEDLGRYTAPVAFWYGENEYYPKKSAELLKKYLPQMEVTVFKGMGHGQMLHEHPERYAESMIAFMELNG